MFLSPEEISLEYIQEGADSRSLSNASARCIFLDSFDNIWIGTWGGGINFISSKTTFVHHIELFPYSKQ